MCTRLSLLPLAFTSNRVQRLRRLVNDKSERAKEKAFAAEGATLIDEAIRAGWKIESQFVAPGAVACSGAGSAVNDLAAGVMERVASTTSPQPVIAIVLKREHDIDELKSGEKDWVVVLWANYGTGIQSRSRLTPTTECPFCKENKK